MYKDTRQLLSDAKYYEGYSRYVDDLGRYETWDEAVDRVMNMHREYYKDKMSPDLEKAIEFVTGVYKKQGILGAQRALQFGGDQILSHQLKMYNCFQRDTKFVTAQGVKSFVDFKDGDETLVITHTGKWKRAVVRDYGPQALQDIVLTKGPNEKTVKATANHRWLLADDTETTRLRVDDRLLKEPQTFAQFQWENSSPLQQLYWCYGYVYGDGTVNGKYSMVRLCKRDQGLEDRFVSMGFKTSSSASLEGDIMVYTGQYLKTLPDLTKDAPELIRAFVAGYLVADGCRNYNSNGKQYTGIQASDEEAIEFIRKAFPVAGVHIISETDKTGQVTNYGTRPKTSLFTTCDSSGSKFNSGWKVRSISPTGDIENVWCLEVEDDHSFILEGGIVTGNCLSTYIDRAEVFGEIFYSSLCGCGVGFSVQKHHIAKLPNIVQRTKAPKIHVVEDSIEGWADALDALMSSYFEESKKHPEYRGHRIYFDLGKIRPKGSKISGGFKAPGPDPLRLSLDRIEHILQGATLSKKKTTLSSIQIYDIIMHAMDAVISGGVRRSATICLFSVDDTEMMNAKTGSWYVDNPQRGRSNNSAIVKRDVLLPEQFALLFSKIKEFGEPGFVFVDDLETCFNPCVEIGMYPQLEGESGFQGCVRGETALITRTGITTIEETVGQEIEIWNGVKWAKVVPFITGKDREFYRVSFGDGSYLDATENHKFLVKHRFEKKYRELTTVELINEHNTTNYRLSVPRFTMERDEANKISVKNAYDFGFILGDGTVRPNKKNASAVVFEPYFGCNFPITGKLQSEVKCRYKSNHFSRTYYWNSVDIDLDFAFRLKYSGDLPDELYSWDRKSLLAFFAGWIDTDGTITSAGSARIYGTEQHIRCAQLLLTSLGINSSVNLMAKKGETTNFATRKRDVWFVQITETKDLYSYKGTLVSKPAKMKGQKQTIVGIDKLEDLKETSYCFEEPETHCGVFNNVLTRQCNLTEINGGMCDSAEAFYELCEAGAILGTIQAGYTKFKFLPDISRKIFEREALIGVSITGWMSNPSILFDPKILRKGAGKVKETNKRIAKLLGINPAARTTTVKPSGNASVLLKTPSGIHPEHSPMYLRNVQISKDNEVAELFVKHNPHMVEESGWSATKTDYAISFPVVTKEGSLYKDDIRGVKHLELVKLVQQNWVEYGTDIDLCVNKSVRHNVSNTIVADDWDEIEKYVYKNRQYFAGISFISDKGDKDYYQAPYTRIIGEKELIKTYGPGAIFASGLIVDGNKIFEDLWSAIRTATGKGEKLNEVDHETALKIDWVRRFNKFALNYFDGDMTKAEYCLKDVFLLHKWFKIQHNLTDIDWTSELKAKKYIDIDTMGAASCVGVTDSGEATCFI